MLDAVLLWPDCGVSGAAADWSAAKPPDGASSNSVHIEAR